MIKERTSGAAVEVFESMVEKSYRARELFNWLFEKNAASFDDMSNFSKELRGALDERFELTALALGEEEMSEWITVMFYRALFLENPPLERLQFAAQVADLRRPPAVSALAARP